MPNHKKQNWCGLGWVDYSLFRTFFILVVSLAITHLSPRSLTQSVVEPDSGEQQSYGLKAGCKPTPRPQQEGMEPCKSPYRSRRAEWSSRLPDFAIYQPKPEVRPHGPNKSHSFSSRSQPEGLTGNGLKSSRCRCGCFEKTWGPCWKELLGTDGHQEHSKPG